MGFPCLFSFSLFFCLGDAYKWTWTGILCDGPCVCVCTCCRQPALFSLLCITHRTAWMTFETILIELEIHFHSMLYSLATIVIAPWSFHHFRFLFAIFQWNKQLLQHHYTYYMMNSYWLNECCTGPKERDSDTIVFIALLILSFFAYIPHVKSWINGFLDLIHKLRLHVLPWENIEKRKSRKRD